MGILNKIEIWVLNNLAKKLVLQGGHEAGIIYFYTVINKAAKAEFTEDTKSELDLFLTDCHKYSLEKDDLPACNNHLWVEASNKAE